MIFKTENYTIIIVEKSNYNPSSTDNVVSFKNKYAVNTDALLPSQFAISVLKGETQLESALIAAEGGTTSIHKTSQVVEQNKLLICCGDTVFCLAIPSLQLHWKTKVDEVTAFEIYKIKNGYIIHGELTISRIDKNGKIHWQKSGSDIFTTLDGKDDFSIKEGVIHAKDWQNRTYKWDFDGNKVE